MTDIELATFVGGFARLIGGCQGIAGPMMRNADANIRQIGEMLNEEALTALQVLQRYFPTA